MHLTRTHYTRYHCIALHNDALSPTACRTSVAPSLLQAWLISRQAVRPFTCTGILNDLVVAMLHRSRPGDEETAAPRRVMIAMAEARVVVPSFDCRITIGHRHVHDVNTTRSSCAFRPGVIFSGRCIATCTPRRRFCPALVELAYFVGGDGA